MREIKCRAWDKINKKFVKISDLIFDDDGSILEIGTEYLDFGDLGNSTASFDFIELMQYTGLKDKNSVEIYEGDIVHHEAGEYSYVGVVETDCYKSYISGIDPVDAFDFDDVSDTRSGTADLEVIGNKFDMEGLGHERN